MTQQPRQPVVAVNMVTWNAEPFLALCLKSLNAQTYRHWTLFVVDNGSTDRTLEIIRRQVPRATIIQHTHNTGFAPAHNEALRHTTEPYALLLNQDIILAEDFLANAVAYLEAHPAAAAIQAKLIRFDFKANKSRGVIDTTGLVIYKSRRVVNRGQGEPDSDQYKEGEIFGADGAAPVYRRAALEAVKLVIPGSQDFEYFDEDFFSYKEDVDLAWRLRLAGWQAVYVPAVRAFHGRGSGDSASSNPLKIIRERQKISIFAKTLSWRNQRFMQIKNEQAALLIRHLPFWLTKEMMAWLYVLLFEPATVKSMPKMFKGVGRAFAKRRLVMKLATAPPSAMRKWFL